MSRKKAVWTGHVTGQPETGERIGRVSIPVVLDHQDREAKINVPVSRIPALIRQLEAAYDTALSLKHWRAV